VHEPSVIVEPKHGIIPIVHVALALEIDDVEHLEERVCESGSRLLPSCRKPTLSEYLMNENVFRIGEMAATVDNLDLMYAVDVVNRKVAKRRYRSRTVAPAMIQLDH
jgi:hypothetical protein